MNRIFEYMKRRSVLIGISSGAVASLSGCLGLFSNNTPVEEHTQRTVEELSRVMEINIQLQETPIRNVDKNTISEFIERTKKAREEFNAGEKKISTQEERSTYERLAKFISLSEELGTVYQNYYSTSKNTREITNMYQSYINSETNVEERVQTNIVDEMERQIDSTIETVNTYDEAYRNAQTIYQDISNTEFSAENINIQPPQLISPEIVNGYLRGIKQLALGFRSFFDADREVQRIRFSDLATREEVTSLLNDSIQRIEDGRDQIKNTSVLIDSGIIKLDDEQVGYTYCASGNIDSERNTNASDAIAILQEEVEKDLSPNREVDNERVQEANSILQECGFDIEN